MKYKSIMYLVGLSLCGCQIPIEYYPDYTDVSWKQNNKDCIYTEVHSLTKQFYNDKGEETYRKVATRINTIKYQNTLCDKVIDFELKNKTNKSAIFNKFNQITSVNNHNTYNYQSQ